MKLRCTIAFDYDADPANYDTSVPSEMCAEDEVSFNSDPLLVMDMMADGYKATVKTVRQFDLPPKEEFSR